MPEMTVLAEKGPKVIENEAGVVKTAILLKIEKTFKIDG